MLRQATAKTGAPKRRYPTALSGHAGSPPCTLRIGAAGSGIGACPVPTSLIPSSVTFEDGIRRNTCQLHPQPIAHPLLPAPCLASSYPRTADRPRKERDAKPDTSQSWVSPEQFRSYELAVEGYTQKHVVTMRYVECLRSADRVQCLVRTKRHGDDDIRSRAHVFAVDVRVRRGFSAYPGSLTCAATSAAEARQHPSSAAFRQPGRGSDQRRSK